MLLFQTQWIGMGTKLIPPHRQPVIWWPLRVSGGRVPHAMWRCLWGL